MQQNAIMGNGIVSHTTIKGCVRSRYYLIVNFFVPTLEEHYVSVVGFFLSFGVSHVYCALICEI